MKKILIILIVLVGLNISAEEISLHNYVQNQTEENFLKVFNFYSQKIKSNPQDYDSIISLATLTQFAANHYANQIESKVDSLGMREKFLFANFLLQQRKFQNAIKIYDDLNKTAPKWSCPWRHKGEAYFGMEDYANAEKALFKAIEVKKNHFDAYILLAQVQEKMKKYPEALKTLETGLTYQAQNTEKEEITDNDVLKLYAKILKENNKMEKYNEVMKKIENK